MISAVWCRGNSTQLKKIILDFERIDEIVRVAGLSEIIVQLQPATLEKVQKYNPVLMKGLTEAWKHRITVKINAIALMQKPS